MQRTFGEPKAQESKITPADVLDRMRPRQHILKLGWETIHTAVDSLSMQLVTAKLNLIVGIARGGLIPATLLSHKLNVPMRVISARSYEGTRRTLQKPTEIIGWEPDYRDRGTLFVDDIVDTGETFDAVRRLHPMAWMISLVTKRPYNQDLFFAQVDKDVWVKFPWEGDEA